jgi:hypothetical protein
MKNPFEDEGGHVDFEALTNATNCDHSNDYYPDPLPGKIAIPKADFHMIVSYLQQAEKLLEANPNNGAGKALLRIWLKTLSEYDI